MHKKRLLIGMCSWNNPNLLKICIKSILPCIDKNLDGLAVVLNEADSESINFLRQENIPFVCLPENRGVLAIDYLIPFIQNSEYFLNTNDDMVFHKGFVEDCLSVMEKHYPCSVSLGLVENFYSANPCVTVDSEIKSIYDDDFMNIFNQRAINGLYDREYKIVSYNHPICVKSSDYLSVGGYSGNWDMDFSNGYCRDDMFPFLLKCLHKNFLFIGLNKSHVFHQSSETMRKLSGQERSKSNQDIFEKRTGMSLPEFREKIQSFYSYTSFD